MSKEFPPPDRKLRKGEIPRKDGRVVRRVFFYLETELARELRLHCADKGRDLSAVASEALRAYLDAVAKERSRGA